MENIFQRPPILMRLTMLTRDKISLQRAASLRTARETAHGLNNRKQRGWVEAGILPLNYSRLPYFSSTYLFLKDLGRSTASLFRLLRPSKTMGFDRKMDSKVDSKPVWEASPPRFSFTVHFTVHPTTDSTYHTVRPLGRTRSPTWRRSRR